MTGEEVARKVDDSREKHIDSGLKKKNYPDKQERLVTDSRGEKRGRELERIKVSDKLTDDLRRGTNYL